jgi:magnesium transporter
MRSNLHFPAPSATLLKFLRSQSEGICFFSANPRGFTLDHAAPRVSKSSYKSAPHRLPYNARCISTSAPRPAIVEANLLNLDFLWPRAATSTTRWNSVQRRQMTKYGTLQPDVSLTAQRSADTHRGWLRHFWSQRQRTPKRLKSDDLPMGSSVESGGEAPMFNLGRNMSPKSANEAKLRCTEFDENGNVVLVNGEFKKSELIAKVCLSL